MNRLSLALQNLQRLLEFGMATRLPPMEPAAPCGPGLQDLEMAVRYGLAEVVYWLAITGAVSYPALRVAMRALDSRLWKPRQEPDNTMLVVKKLAEAPWCLETLSSQAVSAALGARASRKQAALDHLPFHLARKVLVMDILYAGDRWCRPVQDHNTPVTC